MVILTGAVFTFYCSSIKDSTVFTQKRYDIYLHSTVVLLK